MAKIKSKKGMTIEKLARMVQKGFGETATKEETATRRDIEHLERCLEILDPKLSPYVPRCTGDFESLRSWVKEIDSRLRAVEKVKK